VWGLLLLLVKESRFGNEDDIQLGADLDIHLIIIGDIAHGHIL
jgi:hypothetical protein